MANVSRGDISFRPCHDDIDRLHAPPIAEYGIWAISGVEQSKPREVTVYESPRQLLESQKTKLPGHANPEVTFVRHHMYLRKVRSFCLTVIAAGVYFSIRKKISKDFGCEKTEE